ncbi:hypothetical protein RBB84_03680 [Rhodococcus sp. D-6]|uniref:NADPH-dependent FMN reductase n=2 Tax=Rhodococcus TaxID=1827 RepID=H0JTA4_9NOCA|nr:MULTISPECIES: hypothetical protein [Rhodococcus]EHK82781.1 hypothetical protein AK37_14588 [Rhodococcus pyridinivorans AK37]MBX4170464.1 hypothetical protein [Rhodococcus sp. DMU2021]MCD2141033.1 hypothetical protein [Rhodococcus pyridinivorans]QXF80852.1 hypothetical protein HBA53_07150 [Rhodococcus pyridinivorans]UGQ57086.1 hypothetical protein LSF60_17570 [Rhodococcus pyridinivorans]
MTIVVVAGNPKPASRTLDAGARLATALTGREPDHVVDVITLGGRTGALCPAPGLYLHDSTYTTEIRIADYAERWSSVLSAALRNEAAS